MNLRYTPLSFCYFDFPFILHFYTMNFWNHDYFVYCYFVSIVARIALVKPEKARGVEDVLLRAAQMGQIVEKVRWGAVVHQCTLKHALGEVSQNETITMLHA